ncbi:MAG: DUF4286 family protein [Gemmatimonadaceae bacterium]
MSAHKEMLVYEVAVTLEQGADADVFVDWMHDYHIPGLLATRCFNAAEFTRDDTSHLRFRTRYFAIDREALDRYLAEHAPRLRAEFDRRFGQGTSVRREIWEVLEMWER